MKQKLTKIQPQGSMRFHTYLGDNAGCGHIRVIFPSLMLNQFKYKGMNFGSTYNSYFTNDPKYYDNLSFVKFQRSMTDGQLQCIRLVKCIQESSKAGFGVIYEVDDLITDEIPETNSASKYYKEAFPIIKEILSIVDGVTVSTETLKKEILKYNKNVQVIPNRLCKWLWNSNKNNKIENYKPRILWAGSQNHFDKDKGGRRF